MFDAVVTVASTCALQCSVKSLGLGKRKHNHMTQTAFRIFIRYRAYVTIHYMQEMLKCKNVEESGFWYVICIPFFW